MPELNIENPAGEVFSETYTLEPEEHPEQVRAALEERGWSVLDVSFEHGTIFVANYLDAEIFDIWGRRHDRPIQPNPFPLPEPIEPPWIDGRGHDTRGDAQ